MCSFSKLSTETGLRYWGGIIRIGRLINYMASMMSVLRNMVHNQCGNYLLKYSSTCHCQQSSRTKCSVSMEVSHLKSSNLIKSKLSIEFKIFPIKDHFVIYCGLTLQMKENLALGLHLEELVFVGARISVTNSTIGTTWRWSVEHISWSWTATIIHTRRNVWPYSQLPIIAIVVETVLLF